MIVYILGLSESIRNPSGFCFRATYMPISLVCAHPSRPDNFPTFWRIFLVYNLKTSYGKQSIELNFSEG